MTCALTAAIKENYYSGLEIISLVHTPTHEHFTHKTPPPHHPQAQMELSAAQKTDSYVVAFVPFPTLGARP